MVDSIWVCAQTTTPSFISKPTIVVFVEPLSWGMSEFLEIKGCPRPSLFLEVGGFGSPISWREINSLWIKPRFSKLAAVMYRGLQIAKGRAISFIKHKKLCVLIAPSTLHSPCYLLLCVETGHTLQNKPADIVALCLPMVCTDVCSLRASCGAGGMGRTRGFQTVVRGPLIIVRLLWSSLLWNTSTSNQTIK